jgi:hypothetical protein
VPAAATAYVRANIRQAGFAEAVSRTSDAGLRRQRQSIAGDMKVPATAMQSLNSIGMKRARLNVALGARKPATFRCRLGNIEMFEERKTLFRAPEYRKITITAAPADLAKPTPSARRRQDVLRTAQATR